jgi:hypothetical protein
MLYQKRTKMSKIPELCHILAILEKHRSHVIDLCSLMSDLVFIDVLCYV